MASRRIADLSPDTGHGLPSGWELVHLEDICKESQYGLNPSSGRGKRYPMLRMNNLQGGNIDARDVAYIELDEDEARKYVLQPDDLLVNRTNSWDLVGKTALFNLPGEYVFASYLVRFRFHEQRAVAQYVNYFCNSDHGRNALQRLATKGVSQANINPTQLRSRLLIPLPPLPEQRKIVEILGTWDEAIALTEQLIQAKRRRKQAVMQQLVTGKRRFKEFEGQEWPEVRLGDCCEFKAGGTPSTRVKQYWGGTVPWMQSGDIHLKRIHAVDGRITAEGLRNSSARVVPKHSVLIALAGQGKTRGTVAISEVELSTNQSVAAIAPDGQKLNYEYLFYSLESRYEELRRVSSGDGGRGGLSLKLLRSIEVAAPTPAEQQRIAAVLRVCDEEIDLLNRRLTLVREQKKGLMQQLLTGRLRVTHLLEADLNKVISISLYRELVNRGWIEDGGTPTERIANVCSFLGIDSLDEQPSLQMAARQTRVRKPYTLAQVAWGKHVEHLASRQVLPGFARDPLVRGIPVLLRYAARVEDVAEAPTLLRALGVHFLIVPHLPQTYLDGALLYTGENPIVALTLRFDRVDSFWFTLMHELAHLALGHQGVFLDNLEDRNDADEEERQANRQAEDWLLDRDALAHLSSKTYLSYNDIEALARDQERHPSIVAGRIRHNRRRHNLFRKLDVSVSRYLAEWTDRPRPG